MRKLLWFGLCLFVLSLSVPIQPPTPAQENIYGGVQSPRYVTTTEAIWWQFTNIPQNSATTNWAYAIQCKNGNVTPGLPYLLDHGSGGGATGGAGAGFGKNFPCNGYLIYASVVINVAGTSVGNNYVQIMLLNSLPGGSTMIQGQLGALTIPQIEQCLVGVNASSFFVYSWPGTGCRPPSEGPGNNRSVAVTNPAAGSNFQQLLDVGLRVRVLNIQYTLATSAAAGNRFACANFLTGGVSGTIVGQACSPYAQQPSQTVTYEFGAGIGWATNCSFLGATQTALLCADVMIPLPTYWEATNMQLGGENFAIDSAVLSGSGTSGIQAADQISGIQIRVQSWNEAD